jgi:hypothetical protein
MKKSDVKLGMWVRILGKNVGTAEEEWRMKSNATYGKIVAIHSPFVDVCTEMIEGGTQDWNFLAEDIEPLDENEAAFQEATHEQK